MSLDADVIVVGAGPAGSTAAALLAAAGRGGPSGRGGWGFGWSTGPHPRATTRVVTPAIPAPPACCATRGLPPPCSTRALRRFPGCARMHRTAVDSRHDFLWDMGC